jgi:hypothetical protein
VFVVCEGARTEPEYLRALVAHLHNPLVELHIADERGDPLHLVRIAKDGRRRAQVEADRASDPSLAFDEVWCVFDRDEHERFFPAIQAAHDNQISLAVSNPCFELWLLLHLRESPGARHRTELQELLKRELPGYQKQPPWDRLAPGLQAAEARAEQMERAAEARGDGPFQNPSTGVHRLTRTLAARPSPSPP